VKEPDPYTFLRKAGLRMTPLKRSIVDLFMSGGCRLSAAEVCRRTGCMNDRSTVYRCLRSLTDAGFLRHGLGSGGVVLYRCDRRFFPDHGHFRCGICGKTIPVENRSAGEFFREMESAYGVSIDSVDFMLEGKCAKCSKRR